LKEVSEAFATVHPNLSYFCKISITLKTLSAPLRDNASGNSMKLCPWFWLALTGCFVSIGLAAVAPHLRQEEDIRETVFRYQFDHNASALQKSATAYCLSFGVKDADPPDEFMKRFSGFKPAVVKASMCRPVYGVVSKHILKSRVFFRVSSIKWISDAEVRVDGGYYEGSLSASGNTYTVKMENGKWEVTNDEMHWISEALNAVRVDRWR
jgi:hypothetical protein